MVSIGIVTDTIIINIQMGMVIGLVEVAILLSLIASLSVHVITSQILLFY